MVAITYAQYLSRRGISLAGNQLQVARQIFLVPWAAPGFHMFWRRWNPLFGFGLFRLYGSLGGDRNHIIATLAVFSLAGFIHDIVLTLLIGEPAIILTTAWIFFGAASLTSRAVAPRLGFRRWPWLALALLNLSLIAAGLALGGVAQRILLDPAAA